MTNVSGSETLTAQGGPPGTFHAVVKETVARTLRAAERGDVGTRSIMLVGRPSSAARDTIRGQLSASSQLVEFNCVNPTLEAFLPMRAVLDALVPIIAAEAEGLLRRHAPEIAAIYPTLTTKFPAVQPAVPLTELALTPSERRSHRESEQAFRIISGISRLVIDAQRECPTLASAPLTVWFGELDLAERPTLLTFRRLGRWINRARVPVLLVGDVDVRMRAPAEGPSFDWREKREQLVAAIRRDFAGEELHLAARRTAGDQWQPIALDANRAPTAPAGPVGKAIAALKRGDCEEGCIQALFAIRRAVFDLNLEAVMLMGSAIVAALPQGAATQLDAARLEAERERLTDQETSAALEFTLGRLDRARDVLIATWKAVALVHTFLEDHERALDCYGRALELADDRAMRAQLHMYLGLLTGKRLHRVADAQVLLKEGLAAIDGQTDAAATLERGWLLNVSALMAFQTKRHKDAMQMVHESLQLMSPLSSSDAVHLKINLLSNISVLLEATGNIDQALEMWLQFGRFLNGGSDVFAKHYLFREGGLRVKTGDLDGAMSCFSRSFEKAQPIDDDYHAEIAARACGYVAHAQSSFADSARWYGLSADLLVRTGDYDELPRVLLAAALSSLRAGRADAARDFVARAETMSANADGAPSATVKAVARALATTPAMDLERLERDLVVAPSTKLNRPFTLIAVPAAQPSQDR